MDINERLNDIDFKMELLREGTEFSLYLYDCEITRDQRNALLDIMDRLSADISKGKAVSSARYESDVLKVVDDRKHDYHFCELFAKLLWEDRRYEDVFETLYGNSLKYQDIINQRKNI